MTEVEHVRYAAKRLFDLNGFFVEIPRHGSSKAPASSKSTERAVIGSR
jgi:hypothetical protein